MLSTRSPEDLEKAKRCAAILYGEMETVTEEEVRDVMDELPLEKLSAAAMKGKTVADYLVALRCAESKSTTWRRAMSNRGGEATRAGRRRQAEWTDDHAAELRRHG